MRAIVTGAFPLSNNEKQILGKMGIDITFQQLENKAVKDPEKFDIAICNSLFMYNQIEKFKNLKYIQLTSAGMDRIPIKYIREHGITLHNAGNVYAIPMAEWTIMRILEIYKNAKYFYKAQEKLSWKKNRDILELSGKKVCIVGTGNVGCEIAKRLKAFNVKVFGLNKSGKSAKYFDECKKIEYWKNVVKYSDIIILALPLTDNTEFMVDESWFLSMKKTAVFINIARGKLINEEALEAAIKNKRIMAAALDVFEEEPLCDSHPFWKHENILISPHNSFVGENNHKRLFELIWKNLEETLKCIP